MFSLGNIMIWCHPPIGSTQPHPSVPRLALQRHSHDRSVLAPSRLVFLISFFHQNFMSGVPHFYMHSSDGNGKRHVHSRFLRENLPVVTPRSCIDLPGGHITEIVNWWRCSQSAVIRTIAYMHVGGKVLSCGAIQKLVMYGSIEVRSLKWSFRRRQEGNKPFLLQWSHKAVLRTLPQNQKLDISQPKIVTTAWRSLLLTTVARPSLKYVSSWSSLKFSLLAFASGRARSCFARIHQDTRGSGGMIGPHYSLWHVCFLLATASTDLIQPFSLAQSAVGLYWTSIGLGKHVSQVSDRDLTKGLILLYANYPLYDLAISLPKLSASMPVSSLRMIICGSHDLYGLLEHWW